MYVKTRLILAPLARRPGISSPRGKDSSSELTSCKRVADMLCPSVMIKPTWRARFMIFMLYAFHALLYSVIRLAAPLLSQLPSLVVKSLFRMTSCNTTSCSLLISSSSLYSCSYF